MKAIKIINETHYQTILEVLSAHLNMYDPTIDDYEGYKNKYKYLELHNHARTFALTTRKEPCYKMITLEDLFKMKPKPSIEDDSRHACGSKHRFGGVLSFPEWLIDDDPIKDDLLKAKRNAEIEVLNQASKTLGVSKAIDVFIKRTELKAQIDKIQDKQNEIKKVVNSLATFIEQEYSTPFVQMTHDKIS